MKKALYILLIDLGCQFIAGIAVYAMGLAEQPREQGYCMLATDLLAIALLWRLQLAGAKESYPQDLLRNNAWMAALGTIFINFGLGFLLEPLDLSDMGVEALFEGMRSDVLCILMLCVVTPTLEELVFRDGILRHLMKDGVKPVWAVLISALLFGGMHVDPAQVVPASVCGIVLGLLYVRTGNMKLCLPAHILNNSVAIGLMYVPGSSEWTKAWSVPGHIALGLPLLLAGALLIYIIVARKKHSL